LGEREGERKRKKKNPNQRLAANMQICDMAVRNADMRGEEVSWFCPSKQGRKKSKYKRNARDGNMVD
jgi:hypothetical protein